MNGNQLLYSEDLTQYRTGRPIKIHVSKCSVSAAMWLYSKPIVQRQAGALSYITSCHNFEKH